MTLAGEGPIPEMTGSGRRLYTLGQINDIRQLLAWGARGRDARDFVPHRRAAEHLQVIAVANFKGGSGKTTTAAHLAQYLALQGYRVLAVDMDPQASLTTLFGVMPEIDVKANDTLYAVIRYDDQKRPMAEVIRKTYFNGLDLVPGNLELKQTVWKLSPCAVDCRRHARVERFGVIWARKPPMRSQGCPWRLCMLGLVAMWRGVTLEQPPSISPRRGC